MSCRYPCINYQLRISRYRFISCWYPGMCISVEDFQVSSQLLQIKVSIYQLQISSYQLIRCRYSVPISRQKFSIQISSFWFVSSFFPGYSRYRYTRSQGTCYRRTHVAVSTNEAKRDIFSCSGYLCSSLPGRSWGRHPHGMSTKSYLGKLRTIFILIFFSYKGKNFERFYTLYFVCVQCAFTCLYLYRC